MTSVAAGAVTLLLVEWDQQSHDIAADAVQSIVFTLGGTVVDVQAVGGGRSRLTAGFSGAFDATHAAVRLMAQARPGPDGGPRIALYGADPAAGPSADRWLPARTAAVLRYAEPGQVLLPAATAIIAGPTLPRGSALLLRGNLPIGDTRETQRIYELRMPGEHPPSHLDWARRAVGTSSADPDLSTLVAAWHGTVSGSARLVLVTGPGDGHRTMLAGELALRLHAEGAQVLYGRSDPGPPTPFQAFREALGMHADGCDTARLRADLAGHADDIAQILPEVAARIRGGAPADRGRSSTGTTGEALEAWIAAIARHRPLLLVHDDVHRADPESLRLLGNVWHASRRSPLMIVVTAAEEAARPSPGLQQVLHLGEHAENGAFTHIRM